MAFEEGDVLLLYSDGVRSRFDALALRLLEARAAAEDVVATAGRDNDDASCLVVRAVAPSARGSGGAERARDTRAKGTHPRPW